MPLICCFLSQKIPDVYLITRLMQRVVVSILDSRPGLDTKDWHSFRPNHSEQASVQVSWNEPLWNNEEVVHERLKNITLLQQNKLLCVSVYINLPRNAKEQWKTCSQGRRRTQDPVSNSPMQTTQSHSESSTWQVLRIAGWAIACDSAKSYHIAKARNLCLHLAVRVFILKTSKPVKLIWSWCWMPPATSCDTPAYFVASMSSIVPKHTSKGATSFWNITPSWLSIWSSSSYWAPQCNLVFVSGYLQCLKTRPFDSGIPSPRASIQSWFMIYLCVAKKCSEGFKPHC